MKTAILFFCLIITSSIISSAYSQEHENTENHAFKRNRISVFYGNTIVPAAKTATDEQSVLIFPSLGINYEFWFTKHIGIGWLNEFEMQSYVVEHGNEMELDREFPYITTLGIIVVFFVAVNDCPLKYCPIPAPKLEFV